MKNQQNNISYFYLSLGKRIVELRKQQGYSQAELAAKCGKYPQSLERVENGKTKPGIGFLLIIATALEVHVMSLFDF